MTHSSLHAWLCLLTAWHALLQTAGMLVLADCMARFKADCRLSYACWSQAVCCSDKLHCCPHAYTCDVAHSTCLKGPLADGPDTLPWVHHVSAKRVQGHLEKVEGHAEIKDVPCNDTTSCPDAQTCCKMPTGEYGCCPLPEVLLPLPEVLLPLPQVLLPPP